MNDPYHDLERIFRSAVARVDPRAMMIDRLKLTGNQLSVVTESGTLSFDLAQFSRIIVIGGGKAGATMAAGLEAVLGDRIDDGIVAVRDQHNETLSRIRTVVAGHPVPDERSVDAARQIVALASGADEHTLVVSLISGGGSALLCYPFEAGGTVLTLSEKQEVTRLLLSSGATIHETNCVRKHLSGIKGGRLATAISPAVSLNLILSDVVGDNLDAIASGLMVPDSSTYADALAIVRRYGMEDQLPETALKILRDGLKGQFSETPKPGDPIFRKVSNVLLGTNAQALLAAGVEATNLGYSTTILSSQVTGEAREAAKFYLGIAKDIRKRSLLAKPPACVIAGGETTVTVRAGGKGGRNQEMALSFLCEIASQPADTDGVFFLSAGTDGTDGPTDAAGAFASIEVLEEASRFDLRAQDFLNRNDSYSFFDPIGRLLKTGSTNTNVCDVQIVLVR
ncbi:MAG TPA: glycerate kinase [Spirochaetia bacterium]|nr:glycerate kinase [Spirochaetia bacterium]